MAKVVLIRDKNGKFVKGHGKIVRERVGLICKECASPFLVIPYQAKFRKYCSCKCHARAIRRNLKGKNFEERYGVERAKQIRECLSLSRLGKNYPKLSEVKKGKAPKNLDSLHTLEVRQKISKTLKGRHTSPKTEFGPNNPAPVYYKDTKIELAIKDGLIRNRIQGWITHFSLLGICKPDFTFLQERIAVFCDGDYWHNKPNVRQRDRRINRILKEKGWQVLRFWEHEINENVDKCIFKIKEVIQCV